MLITRTQHFPKQWQGVVSLNRAVFQEAKLLLDDYYSGERGGIYGSPDNFLTSYEEEPRTPSAVTPPAPKLTAGSRLSSLDSGATSESDETYKAPPSARTVSSPPRTLVAASQGQTSSKLDAPAVVRYERDELLDLCTQAIAHGNYREYDRLVKHFPDMMPKVAGE
uniref:Uncharacterized protein n=1 Tax=Timema shepardi TaxID=629360 RepID=A0A7R9AX64_TIMSH|nr:unnamed protein product [Timema shepardi]